MRGKKRRSILPIRQLTLALAVGLLVSACAHTPTGTAAADNDPYEATNRDIFAFNVKLDKAVARPVATFYVHAVPAPARDGVHNFVTNIHLPVVFFNDVLQGDVDRAGQSLGRMTVNTTLGIGGLFDVASSMGIPSHDNDFGITLGSWGLGEGPFLMLPLLGPAPPRDLAGKVVDIFMDPITYWNFREKIYYDIGLGALGVIDLRAENIGTLEGIERTSVDYYATTRNLYLQYRAAQIRQGKPDVENLPNF
ncbi:MAG: VacJ family lipoprotein [Alphaproteobacteria bacterium]|nr:VacJ family lipoprotein [Alphaproteobacteria bacterium]